MAKRVVIYTRVSLDHTGDGRSNARQLEACRKLADLREWEIVAEIEETGSAWTGKDRPGWNRILEMVENGEVDIVVAWHIDRMTRSMTDLEKLILVAEKKKVGVATVTGDIDLTSDVGRMVARILAAVARAEVERKAARQRLQHAQRAQEGKPWQGGGRPFGYSEDGLHVVPEEAALIHEAARDVLAGKPLNQVAQDWSRAGYIPPRNRTEKKGSKPWTANGVRDLLLNERNAGILTYDGEEVRVGIWEPILDTETFEDLRAYLSNPARRMGKANGRRPTTLLSRLASCSKCGGEELNVHGASQKPSRLPTYACAPSAHFNAPREPADHYVAAAVIERLLEPDVQSLVLVSDDAKVERARNDEREAREALALLGVQFAQKKITMASMLAATPLLEGQMKAAQAILNDAKTRSGMADLIGLDKVDMTQAWEAMELTRQRALVKGLLDVEFMPGVRGRRGPWDPMKFMLVTPKEAPDMEALALSGPVAE